ncbi:dehydrogenase/reductase SDR family member 1-like [Acanthaster planci]|uniref:Dehydrogenase/reductase SDR family member 1-like n=1 Tax=Acanthaster planci TaxID=133434 RepID=A0A8B7Z7I8_ACAPL|nr:dehydrogenase/reductase SDR family member 1-like [Acanthaster planci]
MTSTVMAGRPFAGNVCLVTGASRGIGKGIALQLGDAGATVYITGRSLDPKGKGKPGSLRDTADEIEGRGGKCIPVQCDHGDDEQVKLLFEKISKEQNGRLDILVNNAYSAISELLKTTGKTFWELPVSMWDTINRVGLRGHYVATWHAAQMMVPAKHGLIVNISSPGGLIYIFNAPYGVGKIGCDRMAVDCGLELKKHNVAMLSLWPGPVKTETLLGTWTAENRTDLERDSYEYTMKYGESTEYSGKAVVHLAKDPQIMTKTGRIFITAEVGYEYGFRDIDGKTPASLRQAKTLFLWTGHPWLAALTPPFVKFPYWLLALGGNHF